MTTERHPADNAGSAAAPDPDPSGRRRSRWAGVGVLAIVLVVALVATNRRGTDGISRARHLTQQDSRFVNGPKAGAAFADISRLLLDDATACARSHGAADARCSARSSAAAYTTVTAFALVGCTQPGVFQARQALLAELTGIVSVDRHHGSVAPPPVPAVPVC